GNQFDDSATNAGAAYVFVRTGTNWAQQAFLKASNTDPFDLFGAGVGLSGSIGVIGAYGEDSAATGVNGNASDNSANHTGAAYVFTGLGAGISLTIAPDGTGGYYLRSRAVPDLPYRLERAASLTGAWTTLTTQTV